MNFKGEGNRFHLRKYHKSYENAIQKYRDLESLRRSTTGHLVEWLQYEYRIREW